MDLQKSTRNPLNELLDYAPTLVEISTENHTYYIVHDPKRLPIDRFIEYEKRLTEVAFKATFPFIAATIRKALNFLDFTPDGTRNCIATLFNLLQGLINNTSRETPVLWLCTTFIIRDDENIKSYDLNLAKQKIKDWTEAGINYGFFWMLATGIAIELRENVDAYSQIFSTMPLNPNFETERINSLQELSIQPSENKTKLPDDGNSFST